MPLTPVIVSRLEKAAMDNGFDHQQENEGDWLVFSSTQCPLRVWLGALGDTVFLAALSQQNVALALDEYGELMVASFPRGAIAARTVSDIPALHRLLRRAFQLSNALPNELLHAFEKKTASLPKSTEAERLMIQRVGQDLFRNGLIEYWQGRCAITGLAVLELLRASHIQPWAECASDAERLDVFNGLLLAAHFDAAFDSGLITIADDGEVRISSLLTNLDRKLLGLDQPLRVNGLSGTHRGYLAYHQNNIFQR